MSHAEYKRIILGADTAVLFIHGIVGTPNHFRDLIPLAQQVPENWSVHNLLLDGHGKKAEDFAASSMEKWKKQVWSAFEKLARQHQQVVIVAHSMGTLFAMQLALEFPDKIPFLFLLGVPLRPGIRLTMIRDLLQMVFGKLPVDSVLWKASGVTTTRKLWKYLAWIPRYLELFREIYITERVMGDLKVPCVAYQSETDELVSNRTRRLLERSGVMEVYNLMGSTHFYYAPEDREMVLSDFAARIKTISHD